MKQIDNPKMSMRLAYDELERDRLEGTPDQPDLTRMTVIEGEHYAVMFAPEDILKTRAAVFQPRTLQGQLGEEAYLLREVGDAIKRAGVEALDPVVVWWSGRKYVVVDGHHRLIAIRRFNRENANKKGFRKLRVPVEVVTGEIAEAKRFSTKENAKAKLSLRKEDRVNWAWRQVALHFGGIDKGKFVMAQRCQDLHVSERLLQQMKATFLKVVALQGDDAGSDRARAFEISEMTWAQAQRTAEGKTKVELEFTDEKRLRAIEAATRKLAKALGPEAFSDPRRAEITGEAILAISGRFLELAGWSPDFQEAMKDALGALSGDGLAELDEDFE
jgi:hypothetical protein